MIWSLLVAAGVSAHALHLRGRLAPLARVGAAPGDAAGGDAGPGGPPDGPAYGMLAAPGAMLPGAVRAAALDHARRHDLQVLDLVPADLAVRRALDLAAATDPRRYRADPLGAGPGAGFVTLVRTDLLARAGQPAASLDPGAHAAATARLRRYAARADIAVVPGRTAPGEPACRGRRARLRGQGADPHLAVAGSAAAYAAVASAAVLDPWWGLAAVAAYCAAPYLALAGGPLRPRDLHRTALLRPLLAPRTWRATLADRPTAWERARDAEREEARAFYREELAGPGRFLEPRRPDCPWCGSRSLSRHVTSGDIVQGKPGRFTLERCRDCRHIFQNPRLSAEGLAFYYRDAYDGLGAATAERLFASQTRSYRGRAALAAAHAAPRAWLDVGAGHGHFCRAAAAVLPGTAFDGLDLGAGVEEGARRGWLRRAHRGRFTELPDDLAGRYDLVSMHHYLEHTPDPQAELDAAAKILPAGGHLLLELPDPESMPARLLGRRWIGWLQPQHLHMIPLRNLEEALAARGLRVVARERRAAHQRLDAVCAVAIVLDALAPPPDRPWAPPRRGAHLRRALAATAAAPLFLAAWAADRFALPLLPGGNAYRVLARKDEG
ncbi:class I SAM-dependent methyltransferase [Actinomadura parmotrematis]|uniref:Class I SAM-dependent methyltransferase n=1 Tax=Actinomadura parmotrematis TaxID=2864039 RepID=A0ABS7FYX9_9ACTN|nr:class I SAM-dependent methyltransferase [Actinomadura parmotrematis]MBW8484782.1 class I SAM-dependent methyltransferase [Actinomadura parmotrematis]